MNAADIIEREKDHIIQQWVETVETEIPHSQEYEQPTIMNSVPDLIDALVEAIRSQDVNHIKVRGETHARQRVSFSEYSLRHIIKEYRLLKRTLFKVLDDQYENMSSVERDIITYVIDEAVEQASDAFYKFRQAEDHSNQEEVEKLLDQMKDQDMLRDQFIAALSHDIRSPLNNTLSAVEMLETRLSQANDKLIEKLLNVIKLSMAKGNDLINNLLNVSLIQSGEHLPIHREEGDLLEEIKTSLYGLNPDIQAKINLQADQAEVIGYWDVKALRRAIDNLVSNALKHGDPGSDVNIGIRQGAHQTFIAVHNLGEPIAKEKQEELFNLYYRAAPEKSKGWGLGLTLVKGIVEAHGGKVEVDSTKEEGTTFTMMVPHQKAKP